MPCPRRVSGKKSSSIVSHSQPVCPQEAAGNLLRCGITDDDRQIADPKIGHDLRAIEVVQAVADNLADDGVRLALQL
jgi:hypothetical protein